MLGRVLRALILFTGAASLLGAATPTRTLTFEDRLRAQEAIERVYYSHLIGETRSFDEAVPPALIENQVRTYLQESGALRDLWSVEITPNTLSRELERISGGTRMPERLLEIYAALGHDSLLIEECFARPGLVDHLARSFFASDARIHSSAR